MSYKCSNPNCGKQIKKGMTQFEDGICYKCDKEAKAKRKKESKILEKQGYTKEEVENYIDRGRLPKGEKK